MKSEKQINIELLYEKVKKIVEAERIILNAPMSKYTSFRTGGNADIMVIPDNEEEIKELLCLFSEERVPYIILGNGSNILVKDSGYRGVVIKLGEYFNSIKVTDNQIVAFAGAKVSATAREAMENGLSGMEFASGIPGSVGGGVFMNAGAYGGEIKDIILSVTAITRDGSKKYEITKELMQLGYRHSTFQESGDIIVSATFQLKPGEKSVIAAEMKELMDRRNQKQPVNLPSAGSFFKRPNGYYAGQLIQDSGLKGLSVGGAQVSPLHAGFIVNNGSATTTDILNLMKLVQNTVFNKFGVKLEPEVRILGD